jgi:GAF domain-containing protein
VEAIALDQAVCDVLRRLLEETRASRVTLRRDVPGDVPFPVVEEVLAPGVGSLRGERSVHLPTQPVVLEVQKGNQVVQHDSRASFDDPEFQRMLDVYGGLAAQIVTPVAVDGSLRAIVSLHQLGAPRTWTDGEIGLARAAAEQIGELL